MTDISVNIMRTAIILSLAVLSFSGTFSAIQYLPSVQAQTQTATTQSTVEELNERMAQLYASNKPEDIATLAYIGDFRLSHWNDNSIL